MKFIVGNMYKTRAGATAVCTEVETRTYPAYDNDPNVGRDYATLKDNKGEEFYVWCDNGRHNDEHDTDDDIVEALTIPKRDMCEVVTCYEKATYNHNGRYMCKKHYKQEIEAAKQISEHPLLNPDSSHYEILGDESIAQFEKMFTTEELMAWAKITYYKYMFRLGKKDAIEKELHKMKTYEDYYNYLKDK